MASHIRARFWGLADDRYGIGSRLDRAKEVAA